MNRTGPVFNIYRRGELQKPAVIVGFKNEIGNVGGGMHACIISGDELTRVGSLKLEIFFTFNGVNIEDDVIVFPESDFDSYDRGNLLFFRSDVPNREPYEFCNAILDFATQQYDAEEIFTLGGFAVPISHLSPRRVFGTTTNPELRMLLTPYDVSIDVDYRTPEHGPRPSLNHFLLWVARQREIPAYSLWVEVPFYLANLNDPVGTRALLNVLDKRFALGLDFTGIDGEIEEVNGKLDSLMNQNPQVNHFFKLLEQGISLSQEEGEVLVNEVAAFLKSGN